jgi:hypothetical protein
MFVRNVQETIVIFNLQNQWLFKSVFLDEMKEKKDVLQETKHLSRHYNTDVLKQVMFFFRNGKAYHCQDLMIK